MLSVGVGIHILLDVQNRPAEGLFPRAKTRLRLRENRKRDYEGRAKATMYAVLFDTGRNETASTGRVQRPGERCGTCGTTTGRRRRRREQEDRGDGGRRKGSGGAGKESANCHKSRQKSQIFAFTCVDLQQSRAASLVQIGTHNLRQICHLDAQSGQIVWLNALCRQRGAETRVKHPKSGQNMGRVGRADSAAFGYCLSGFSWRK
ncbi:hypothetical protein BOTBODRAFT_289784 [Botryobasidium botryosum FD-172 SS1]|uniref:Uncharacterized protein n=1 Tax=Botryobasidium botryosum (strain FD-172 SS1) TaxID=930990 RepID=A0A067MKX7_BOTB1|nr:hypothetical protein BOTBODRAFT_289784 [Botryobasidium botryosum FD-172 SS1]